MPPCGAARTSAGPRARVLHPQHPLVADLLGVAVTGACWADSPWGPTLRANLATGNSIRRVLLVTPSAVLLLDHPRVEFREGVPRWPCRLEGRHTLLLERLRRRPPQAVAGSIVALLRMAVIRAMPFPCAARPPAGANRVLEALAIALKRPVELRAGTPLRRAQVTWNPGSVDDVPPEMRAAALRFAAWTRWFAWMLIPGRPGARGAELTISPCVAIASASVGSAHQLAAAYATLAPFACRGATGQGAPPGASRCPV